MIVTASTIQMSSQRNALEFRETRESLRVWKDRDPSPMPGANQDALRGGPVAKAPFNPKGDAVSVSEEARRAKAASVTETGLDDEESLELMADLRLSVFKMLIEKLTGRKIEIRKVKLHGEAEELQELAGKLSKTPGTAQDGRGGGQQGWGLVYNRSETHYQAEHSVFAASGVIKTADGSEIGFEVSLSMSHEFMSSQNLTVRAGDALKDPLVLNFGGTAAQLSEKTFAFDIDMDGSEDQISRLISNSAFLALDKNGDGRVNDGSELFGPATGDGFAELSAHDQDGNNWIDENDSIFDKLRLWSVASDNSHQLVALGEKGIGALYLGAIDTGFGLRGKGNELLGAVRTSGLYLREDGTPGTIQQLDLVV